MCSSRWARLGGAGQSAEKFEIQIYFGNRRVSEASNNFKGEIDMARFHVKSTNASSFGGMFNSFRFMGKFKY